MRLHNSTHLPIIPDGVCFWQDYEFSYFEVSFTIYPFFPFLKWFQEFFTPVAPEFVHYMLNLPQFSAAV